MNDETKDLLEEELKRQFEKLSELDSGSEEYEAAMKSAERLYKLKNESEKNYIEDTKLTLEGERNTFDQEKECGEKQHRYIRLAVDAAGIVLPLVFYGVWMKRGLRFEETGTYTSTTFRNLFGKFKPTGK